MDSVTIFWRLDGDWVATTVPVQSGGTAWDMCGLSPRALVEIAIRAEWSDDPDAIPEMIAVLGLCFSNQPRIRRRYINNRPAPWSRRGLRQDEYWRVHF